MERPVRPRETELLVGLRAVDCISGNALFHRFKSEAAHGRRFLSLGARAIKSGRWPWLMALMGGLAGFNLVCRLSLPDKRSRVLLMSATANNRRQLKKVEDALPDMSPQWMEVRAKRSVSQVSYALWEVVRHPSTSIRVLRLLSKLMVHKHPMHAIDRARYVVANLMMRRALRQLDPQIVVVSNDHTPACVAIAAAARAQGKPTVYLQHAHVSPLFPPLNFDLNVLDSQAALDIYEARGPRRGRVIFKGIDGDSVPLRLKAMSEPVSDLTVGVVLNNSRPQAGLFKGLAGLVADERVSHVFVRPHPASPVGWYDDLPEGVELRMARAPLAVDARNADLILAGNTSAVLEALKAGAPTVLWESIDNVASDYYGFVAHRLVPTTSDPAALSFSAISAFFSGDWTERMRYFDASYMADEAVDLRAAMLEILERSPSNPA